jgi:hypothetical protein
MLNNLNETLGFELGWDYARYGVMPPIGEFSDLCQRVNDGYKAGCHHFDGTRPKIRFNETEFKYHKKWLNLRLSAFKRARILSDDLTPDYLKIIDGDYCPVTRLPFTHGLGLPTDATVERINNNGGYARGNVCILSLVANKAKGSRSFSEVLRFAISAPANEAREGLSAKEWARLACLSSYGCDPDEQGVADTLPMVCCPLPLCSLGSKLMVMKFVTSHLLLPSLKDGIAQSIFKAYKKLGDKKVTRALEKFYENGKGAYNRAYHATDVRYRYLLMEDCWENAVLFNSWTNLVRAVGNRFPEIAMSIYPLAKDRIWDQDSMDTRSWGLESGGYLNG